MSPTYLAYNLYGGVDTVYIGSVVRRGAIIRLENVLGAGLNPEPAALSQPAMAAVMHKEA
jgi:hypothetical protein